MLVSPATGPPLTAGQGLGKGELWANCREIIGFGNQQGFPLEVKVDIAKESSSEDRASLRGLAGAVARVFTAMTNHRVNS